MNKLKNLAIVLLALLVVGVTVGLLVGANTAKIKELQVDHLFQDTQGTIMMKNLRNDKTYAYNLERSRERFTPESTFKVPNALIGLEEQAVEDEYDVKRWDGTVRQFEEWCVSDAHLIGASYGGWITLNQAVHSPRLLQSITLLEPARALAGLSYRSWVFMLWASMIGPDFIRRAFFRWTDAGSLI